ncbi:MAG TPA: hypothetical protein VFC51_05720 [Chloroflexota bacterium]|nr:hypothetical protein [Chloroflexota bacterium]
MGAKHRARSCWVAVVSTGAAIVSLAVFLIGPGPVRAQDDPTLLRELAVRLLDQQYAYGSATTTAQERVQLLPGRLPDDPSLALPTPPGGRLIGSMVRPAQQVGPGGTTTSRETVSIVYDVPGTPDSAEQIFTQAVLDLGWTPAPIAYTSTGGFQQTRTPRSATFCQTTGPAEDPNSIGPSLTVSVTPGAPGFSDVRVSTSGYGPPCWTPTLPGSARAFSPYGGSYGPASAPSLPTLTAPDDVVLQSVGGSYGGLGSTASEARATTSRTLGELFDIFAPQLAAAGWEQIEKGATEGVAWSTWRVPSDDDMLGMLLLIRLPGQDQTHLAVRVYSTSTGPGSLESPHSSVPAAPPTPDE